MYIANARKVDEQRHPAIRPRLGRVGGNVMALGMVSLVTDVSSEMVTAVLPLYLVVGLGLSPLVFGLLDGLYIGATALARIVGGHVADRFQRRKLVAGIGYGMSAGAKVGLLAAGGSVPILGTVLTFDRAGKGLRTAPRDALISLSVDAARQGRAFGVHRAMDTFGAFLGPVAAFGLLWSTGNAYDAVFVVSACVATFGVILLVLTVRDHRDPIREASATSIRAGLRLLRDNRFRRICVAAAVLGFVTVSDGFLYLLLNDRMALESSFFPLLPLGTAGFFLLLALPVGLLADRIDRRWVFLGGYALLLLAYVVLQTTAGAVGQLVPVLVVLA
ncbi:MAG: MFS transporter, partial [Stackebrandtia sp.]